MSESFEKSFEDQLEALATIDIWHQERQAIIENRAVNSAANVVNLREAFQRNKNVKSDVKKSSAFVKKIRTINAEGIQQCIRDTDTLNLTQYISEIVSAILATTYKVAEMSYVVKLAVTLHQKYEEFTEPLISGLKTILLSVPNEDDVEGAKKKRLNIRLAIELHQQGLLVEDEVFCQLMRNLLGKGKLAQMNASGRPIVDLQGFSMLVKFGAETLFGFLPKQAKDIATKAEKTIEDIPSKLLVNSKAQSILRTLLNETYDHLCADLVKAHKDFRTRETKCEKDRLIHGNVTEQKQQEFDQAKRLYERLLSIVTTLSDATGADVPELKVEKEEEEVTSGLAVFDGAGISVAVADEAFATGGIFGDAETKSFYEDLPDLLSLVPLSVLGLTPEQAAAMREEWSKQSQQEESAADLMAKDEVNVDGADGDAPMDIADDGDDDLAAQAATATAEEAAASNDDVNSTNASIMANKVDVLINNKLPECNNKQKCDEFCVSFCYLNSKSARKKLITALSRLPRFRLELAPFYARIIASLSRLFPDIVEPILEALRCEFFGILKARRQVHVDGKLRNVRYQAEIVKFRAAPPIVAFRMMKALMTEFTPHNVEMLVAVMETCGRFLFLVPFTHSLMKENLETMMRLRRARNLDIHQQTLLESAYFAVKPPEKTNKHLKKKELTIVQKYVRFLLLEKLEQPKVSVEDVIKHLRRLPWQDPQENVTYHVVKAALKVARTKYVSLPHIADCLSGLSKYYAHLIIMLVDRIMEEIQRALEIPYKREIQRILGLTRLLGELYNFTAIPSTVIFDCLYHVLQFGHEIRTSSETTGVVGQQQAGASSSDAPVPPFIVAPIATAAATAATSDSAIYDPRIPCEADPPTDLFRGQIICELLNTTGMYFVRGTAKEKLNRFLTYFQRYLLTKQMIPMHVEFTILDCFDSLDNLAKEAAMDLLQKQLLAQQQSSAVKKSRKDRSKKASVPVVTEWMVSGYQFARFDSFESAHRAVEVYEGKSFPATAANAVPSGSDAATANNDSVAVAGAAASEGLSVNTPPFSRAVETSNKQQKPVGEEEEEEGHGSEDEGEENESQSAEEDDNDEDRERSDDGSSSDGSSTGSDDDDDDSSDDDDEEDDDDDDDDEEADDDEDDDEEDDEGEDEEDDDEEEGLSEDEAARVLEKMRIAEEDDEFERAFKSVLQESRASVVTKNISVDKMAIPAILPKPKNVYTSSSSTAAGNEDEEAQKAANTAYSSSSRNQVAFKLLSRDTKGRIEARQLLVPREHSIVQHMIKSEEELRIQRERVVERTLMLSAMNAESEGYPSNNPSLSASAYSSDYFFGQREVYHGPSNSNNDDTGANVSGKFGNASARSVSQGDGNSSSLAILSSTGGNPNAARVNRSKLGYRSYEESKRAATTLDLDGFLAESNKAEIRRITSRKNT